MFEIFAPTNIKIPFGLSNFFLRRAGAGGAILFRSAASSGVRSGGLCRVPAGCAGFRRTAGQAAGARACRRRLPRAGAGFRRAAGGGTGSVMRPEPGHVDEGCRGGRRVSAGGGRRDRQCHAAGAGARRRRLPLAGAGFRRAAGGGTGSVMRPEPGHVDGGCRGGRRAGGRQRSTGWRSPGAARYIRSGTSIPSSDMPRRITRATCCARRRRMARFAASSSRRIEWSW